MNKYQRLIIVVAALDILILLLFPPLQDTPLARGTLPGLSGFFPIIMRFPGTPIYSELLTLELIFVGANALTAWLVLQSPDTHDIPGVRAGRAIVIFAAVNLSIILLFPPFEPYNTLAREFGSSFDSFYFVFGARSARPIFGPLLYLEVVFVVINALAVYLLFNTVRRTQDMREEHLLALAETMDPDELAALTDEMRAKVEAQHIELRLQSLGRSQSDRRRAAASSQVEEERRDLAERRHVDS